MLRYEPLQLRIAVVTIWLSCLAGFAFVTSSQWGIPIAIVFLSLYLWLTAAHRLFAIALALICLLFCFIRFEFARIETDALMSAIETPAVFEIASDPQNFVTFLGSTYSADVHVKTVEGELLVRLNHPDIASARISSHWSCALRLDPSPLTKRYRAFARCLDEPVKLRDQNNIQFFGDVFRSALQQLTSGRYESLGAQLLPGLVVGDTSRQTPYLEDTLRASGLGHLTAVSGANVAIVLVAVSLVLNRTRLVPGYRLIVLLSVLGAYLVVVRPEPSVVRASVMAVVALAYWFLGLQKYGEGTLLISVIILLLIDPWLALSWGFALSAAATFGLIVLPRAFGVTPEDHWMKKSLGVALSAGIATFPILVAMGSAPSFASIFANVFAEIFVAPATILGLLAAALACLQSLPIGGAGFLILATFLADVAIGSAQVICWIAELALKSWFHIPVLSLTGVLIALSGVVIWRRRTSRGVRLISSIILFSALATGNISPTVPNDWTLASCDVGQGDSTLIRTGSHSVVMVDTGDNPEALEKCLRAFAVDTVETLIITHIHQDHYGAFEHLKSYNPSKIILPSAYVTAELRLRFESIFPAVVTATTGYIEEHSYGHFNIVQVGSETGESGTDVNNSGVVVFVWSKGVNALLLADIEIEAQAKLVSSAAGWNINLVKIAHHGSRYQHPELAQNLSAQFGWISVGVDNPYSHPHPEMIAMYREAGTHLYSTADCGHLYLLSTKVEMHTSRACHEL